MIKKIFMLLLFFILINGCLQMHQYKHSIENINLYALNNNEVLIAIYSKIIKHGTISFLERINIDEVKQTIYSYSINVDSNKFICSKYEEKIFSLKNINDKIDISSYFTTNQFNTQHKNNKYYKCISDNFLEITNKEKMNLLNEISNKIETIKET